MRHTSQVSWSRLRRAALARSRPHGGAALILSCATLWLAAAPAAAADITESFQTATQTSDGSQLGACKQLTVGLTAGGSLTVGNGSAALSTPNGPDAAFLTSTGPLPSGDYKVIVEVSKISFPQNPAGQGENGVTLLAIADTAPQSSSEEWWKSHRIVGVEADMTAEATVQNTIYVNYWNALNTMLSWNGSSWVTDWTHALIYDPAQRYRITVEKASGNYSITVAEAGGTVLSQASISTNSVMQASAEYLIVGDRLTDAFHGSMEIHSVTMPTSTCAGAGDGGKADLGSIDPPFTDGGGSWDLPRAKNPARSSSNACDCRVAADDDVGLWAMLLPALLIGHLLRARRRR